MSNVHITTRRGDHAALSVDTDAAKARLHDTLMPELDRQLRTGMKASTQQTHETHQAAHQAHLAHLAHVGHLAHLAHLAHVAHDTKGPATSSHSTSSDAAVQPAQAPDASSADRAPAPAPRSSSARSVAEAAGHVVPKFMPVLRGDEATKDAAIHTQADFARAVDQTALDYGLDPKVFRAQLEVESGALTNDFRQAMRHEGDLGRAAENNTSIGIGQISRKFLDGREWSGGGPGNPRVGGQVVTTAQYMDSPTVQLRMAASNVAQRIADNGGLERGLSYYVSGNAEPNANGQSYIAKIDERMKNPAVVDI